MMKRVKAIQIFYDYERFENRMPTKEEWEKEFYGRVMRPTESRYYYQVRKRFLQECEA